MKGWRSAVLLGGVALMAGCADGPTAPEPLLFEFSIAPRNAPKNVTMRDSATAPRVELDTRPPVRSVVRQPR